MLGHMALAGYAATVPVANWLIDNTGTICVPNGPCLLPVAPGLMAPSGVLMVGMALTLRDVVQRQLGAPVAFMAVLCGAMLSATFAPSTLVIASAVAFLLSELADMAIYTPLQQRRLIAAVILSGIAGAVVDSAIFLWLAFGSLDFIAGQVVGKMWATLAALPVLFAFRTKEPTIHLP